jgi:putative membrane protein
MSSRRNVVRVAAAAALVLAPLALVPSVHAQAAAKTAKLDDPTIVAIFDAANTWDIETGTMAEKKGSTKEVRDYGEMIARDHKAVRQLGRDLAAKLGVTPTPPKNFGMAKDHAAAVSQLEAAKGKAFDRAFLQHEVAFHKAVIDAINTTLLPSLQNEEVKNLVKKVAPAFQAHMAAAQNLLDKSAAN